MSGVNKGVNDISTIFPHLVKEWDYEKNNNLTPDMVSAHSNKKMWWKCEKGHSFCASPDHRSRGQNCPFCSGKQVLAGFNDLATITPIVAQEWDYEKNKELLPTMITAGSKKNVWWKCQKCGHSWLTSPNSRKYGNRECPKCADLKRVISFRKAFLKEGKNDLLSQASEIMQEWDYELNVGINPADYTVNSKEKVWWKCRQCGKSWQATISNRAIKQSGCPKCKKHERTSFPEQAIFFYISKKYEDAENSYYLLSDGRSLELDVFIPSLKIGIEYDGVAWHTNESSYKRDHKKYLICQNNGIKLIRVSEFQRENNSDCDVFILRKEHTDSCLNETITILLNELGITALVDVTRDRAEIMKQYILHIENKSIAVRYPDEARFWDVEKNKGLTPEMINATSNVTYWWKCDIGHSYKAAPANRLGTGNGCPYCSGKRILPGFNDLQTKYPAIAKQWCYEKNGSLKPTEIASGSQRKVWWQCDKGHYYQCVILNKVTTDMPCPYCSNRLTLQGFNDLATTNPQLLPEWDYEKNKHIHPTTVNNHYSKKAWWKCSKGHSWAAAINTRVNYGTGCPYCSNRFVLSGYNDLLTNRPELAKEWDYDKNTDILPENVVTGSNKKIWWKCSYGHSWEATLASRVSTNSGCPYCANQKFKTGYNDLKTKYPELAREWNYEKNHGLLPENVIGGGEKRVWWKCDKGHEWQAVISSRISGRGCPYCSNKKLLPGYNDFATVYPELVHEWNYEKNGDLKPENVSCGSMTKVWWKCSKGHEWYLSPNQRRRLDGTMAQCKYCAGKMAIPGETDLATTRPDLVEEWNYVKNTDISPAEVKSFSAKKVWWKCSKCSFEWQATIANRSGGSGCPNCSPKGSGSRKKVLQVETGKVFDSIKDASESTGCDRHQIGDCCSGKRKNASGSHWKYVN